MSTGNMVDIIEMSKRLGITIPTMSNMARKSKGFPKPLDTPGPRRMWDWDSVKEWNERRLNGILTKAEFHREQLAKFDRELYGD